MCGIGMLFDKSQCYWLDHKDDSATKVRKLMDRIELIDNNETMPPLAIYPEGTVTNNSVIGTFKRGAFMQFKPVKILVTKLK